MICSLLITTRTYIIIVPGAGCKELLYMIRLTGASTGVAVSNKFVNALVRVTVIINLFVLSDG